MTQLGSSFRTRFTRTAGLAAAGLLVAAAQASAADGQILREDAPSAIKDSYIVVLKDSKADPAEVGASAKALTRQYGGAVSHTYSRTIRGFAARMSEAQAKKLAARPSVAYVEQNPRCRERHPANTPSWGLDRIDQRDLPLNNTLHLPHDRVERARRTSSTPASASRHSDFGGRASVGHQHHRRRQRAPTATATARTSPAPSAAPPTAWPRASRWSPCGCSTAQGSGSYARRHRRHRLGDRQRTSGRPWPT